MAEIKTRIGPNSAAHEMLRVINHAGGTMNAQALNKWNPDYVNAQRTKGTYVSSGYFSRNFSSNMYVLLCNGLATIIPSNKSVDRIITITDLGRSELMRLEPKAIAKQAEIEDRNKAAEINESVMKAWETAHKDTTLLNQFLDMGFQEVLKEGPSPQPGIACENPRCRVRSYRPGGHGGSWGTVYTLHDGNIKVVLFQCQCSHQQQLRMVDEIKPKFRGKHSEDEDE